MPRSLPTEPLPDWSGPPTDRAVSILGVPIMDWSMHEAITFIEAEMSATDESPTTVFFANAHTLNIACQRPSYRDVLGRADRVFGDGTGVRWAARFLHQVHLRDNVNGTDLVPALFTSSRDRNLSYYLVGATEESIEVAATEARALFPGWTQAGHHHGYLDDLRSAEVIAQINSVKPDLLLVGMGNPLQEIWLDKHRDELDVRVCLATGGLFTYWAGEIDRAPRWMRRVGLEWLHLLRRQPHKLGRYAIGNPLFVARVVRQKCRRNRP